MASLNFFSGRSIVESSTKRDEEPAAQPAARLQERLHRVRTFDEIILSGLTKFFNVSLIAGHTYKTRGERGVDRPDRSLLISLTLSSRTFVFAVLQAYIVLRGDDNARIVYLLGLRTSLYHFRPSCFQSCTLDLLFHLLSSMATRFPLAMPSIPRAFTRRPAAV